MVRSFKKGEVLAAKLGTMACPTEMSPQTVKWLFTENSGRYPQNHPDPLEALGAEANRCIGNTRRNTRCWTLRINTDHVQPAHDFFETNITCTFVSVLAFFVQVPFPQICGNQCVSRILLTVFDGFEVDFCGTITIYIYGAASASPPHHWDGCSVLLLMVPPPVACGGVVFGMLVMGGQSCFLWFPPCGLWWCRVWDVGDGWPVLFLIYVCMYVCR